MLAAAVVLALGVGRGDSAVCELARFPEQDGAHVAAPPPDHEYNSFPPTSGPSSDTPLVWGAYEEPVAQFRVVHNLLHGGVAVQYGAEVPDETVERLRAWYAADPDGVVLAPLPALDDRIALTAWTQLATCAAFVERQFTSFRGRHRFNGPERPPRESLRPPAAARPTRSVSASRPLPSAIGRRSRLSTGRRRPSRSRSDEGGSRADSSAGSPTSASCRGGR